LVEVLVPGSNDTRKIKSIKSGFNLHFFVVFAFVTFYYLSGGSAYAKVVMKPTLDLSNTTSKFRTVAMFVITDFKGLEIGRQLDGRLYDFHSQFS
jgi:hypothetical protein